MCKPSPNEIYFHTHTATSISNDVPKFLENNLLRLRNQTVNKITQKLDYTVQLLSTQKVIQSQRLKSMSKVSSFLTDTPLQSLLPLIDSSINDAVINVALLLNYSFFQMVDMVQQQ